MKALSAETTNLVESVLRTRLQRNKSRAPVTEAMVCTALKLLLDRVDKLEAGAIDGRAPKESLTRQIRGMAAMKNFVLDQSTVEADLEYVRALSTGATPGSFLAPTITAASLINQLSQYAAARTAGARIWPMDKIQFLVVPQSVANSTFVWMSQNSRQTSSDLSAASLVFDLKVAQSFELVPMQLFRAAPGGLDALLEDSLASGAAEAEDAAMFATSTLSADAPVALMSASGITILKAAGGSLNGGNVNYVDLLGVLQKSVDLKVRGPLCWFMAGRTLLRMLTLYDTASSPILLPTLTPYEEGGGYSLLGWPIFPTTSIPTNEAVGSGSSQSHLILTPPRAIHIGESNEVELAVSQEFAFDSAQVALRVSHRVAFSYGQSSAIIALIGIN